MFAVPRNPTIAALALTLLVIGGFSVLPASSWASPNAAGGPTAPMNVGVASSPGHLPASPTPSCSFTNYYIDVTMNGTGNSSYTTYAAGPVPVTVALNVTLSGGGRAGNYTYGVVWGDGNSTNGTAWKPTLADYSFFLGHTYTIAAIYYVTVSTTFSCGPYSFSSGGTVGLQTYGPAGPNPVTVTSNVTNGTVPLAVAFDAVIKGAPMNSTAAWTLELLNGLPNATTQTYRSASLNQTVNQTYGTIGFVQLNLTLLAPGLEFGSVAIVDPAGGLVYSAAILPTINVSAPVSVAIAHTPVTTGSPWNVTFWANATNATGAPYTGSGSLSWTFSPFPSNGALSSTGPINGSPVWRAFVANATGRWNVTATASLTLSGGAVIGQATAFLLLDNGSVSFAPPLLSLTVTPSNGSAPLAFNVSAQLLPPPGVNASWIGAGAPYLLNLTAMDPNGSVAWQSSTPGWSGNLTTVPGRLNSTGTYRVVGWVYQYLGGTWVLNTTGNASSPLRVVANLSVGTPSVGLAIAPSTGGTPLNVTVSVTATGGLAPYIVSVCLAGPSSTSPASGTCSGVFTASGWDGHSQALSGVLNASGNYTYTADVVDALSQTATASVTATVAAPVALAPLTVTGSTAIRVAESATGTTFEFVTAVSGGAAPYTTQWTFGDGSYGSSLPGATIEHTYVASGSYLATLTVTDARGASVHTTIGPLVVSVGGASGTDLLSLTTVGLALAAAVVIGSVVALAGSVAWLFRRRQALRWADELERRADRPDPPDHRP